MFYIVEIENVGPNAKTGEHWVEITNQAPRTNSSNEVRTQGWLGTFNDMEQTAHGEYETLEEARAAIQKIFGNVTEYDCDLYVGQPSQDTVEMWNATELVILSNSDLKESLYYFAVDTGLVDATTTDAELAVIANDFADHLANDWSQAPYSQDDVIELLEKYRAEAIEEAEAVAEAVHYEKDED